MPSLFLVPLTCCGDAVCALPTVRLLHTDRGHSLPSLLPPPAAGGSLPELSPPVQVRFRQRINATENVSFSVAFVDIYYAI